MAKSNAISPGEFLLYAQLCAKGGSLSRKKRTWRGVAIAVSCLLIWPGTSFAQWAVHDALNYVKSTLSEAHLVEQVQETVQIFNSMTEMRNAISRGTGVFKAFFAVNAVEDLGKFTGADLSGEIASGLGAGASQAINDANTDLMQVRKTITSDVAQIQTLFGTVKTLQQAESDAQSVMTSTLGFIGPLSTALPSMKGLDVTPDAAMLTSPAAARIFSYRTFGAAAPSGSPQDWRQKIESRKDVERFNAIYDAHGQALYQAVSAAGIAARLQKLEADAHSAAASESSDLKSELYQLTHAVLAQTGETAALRALLAAYVRMEAAGRMPPGTAPPIVADLAAQKN